MTDGSLVEFMDIIDSDYLDRTVRIDDRSFFLPENLRTEDFRFCLVRPREKRAFENGWQNTANYRWHDPVLIRHLEGGGNYGVIGGYGGLVVIDIDNEKFIDPLRNGFPSTFTVQTGKGVHLYFAIRDQDIPSKTMTHIQSGERVGELKGRTRATSSGWGYVVGPGSIHTSGAVYELIDDRFITSLFFSEFISAIEQAGITIEAIYRKRGALDDRDRVRDRVGTSKSLDPHSRFLNPHSRSPTFHSLITPHVHPDHRDLSTRSDDPDYLKYLPYWYRSYHRARDGSIFRGHDGRIRHLRICATLKKRCGEEEWKVHCHHLTKWMFTNEYDLTRTEKELGYLNEMYYYRL